jgi:hypothetical protein
VKADERPSRSFSLCAIDVSVALTAEVEVVSIAHPPLTVCRNGSNW